MTHSSPGIFQLPSAGPTPPSAAKVAGAGQGLGLTYGKHSENPWGYTPLLVGGVGWGEMADEEIPGLLTVPSPARDCQGKAATT